jgi:outer membrane protein
MNKFLISFLALLTFAVIFLFFKLNSLQSSGNKIEENGIEKSDSIKKRSSTDFNQLASTPTGKIAYLNIDRLNEESLEIADLVSETKRRKGNIEASVESLSMQYRKKVEAYQLSAKAGIASQSELKTAENEIMALEKEAQNKQLQMDNLSMDINEKNAKFQKNVRDFLVQWNNAKFDYIFSYSETVPSMLLGNKTLEITDVVIKEINNEYKSSKIKK